jgi:hypothetical protein
LNQTLQGTPPSDLSSCMMPPCVGLGRSAMEGLRVAASVAKLVSAFERGIVTRPEAINKLMQLAADTPPAVIAADLPAAWLAGLRRDCERHLPCPAAGGMLVFGSVCAGYDAEAARRAFEASWRAGLAEWQGFFNLSASQDAEPIAAADRGRM